MANAPILKVRTYGSTGSYTDLSSYITTDGLKWGRNDIDASDAGRDQAGLMHRARVAIKVRLDVSCRPLTESEVTTILTALKPEWLDVQYYDIQDGAVANKKMYSNNIPATFKLRQGTTNYWVGLAFPLIEA